MTNESNWEDLAAQLGAAQEAMEKSLNEMKARDEFELAERQAILAHRRLQIESMRFEKERTELYRRETEGVEKYRADMLQVYRDGFAAIVEALKQVKP